MATANQKTPTEKYSAETENPASFKPSGLNPQGACFDKGTLCDCRGTKFGRVQHSSDEWKEAHYEKGDTQTFYNEFFDVFGVTRRRVASFEEPVKKVDKRYGFIDLFRKGVLLVDQKRREQNFIWQPAEVYAR